ncbi:MAG: DUF1902 domain-containing protein [Nostoc sp.]
MAQIPFKGEAFWDLDAEVWVATSDDSQLPPVQ